MINNTDRILNAAQAIKAYREIAPYAAADAPKEVLTDLLADLRHFARSQNIDFAKCDTIAAHHFNEERSS